MLFEELKSSFTLQHIVSLLDVQQKTLKNSL